MRPPKDSPAEGASADLGEQVEESEKISAAEKSLLQKVIRKGLVDSHHDLEVQRKDPTSPLYSVKSFAALNL
jgi:ATP-dependent RNA helicase DDX19/DBP5